jgi:hypothetical protein
MFQPRVHIILLFSRSVVMNKSLLFAALLTTTAAVPQLLPASQAKAEINLDVGCDDASKWSAQTGWSVTGSKCHAAGVISQRMLMQSNNKVYKNHWYQVTITTSNYSAGKLRLGIGFSMPATPAGQTITLASTSDIPSEFTPAVGTGLTSGFPDQTSPPYNLTGPGLSVEDIGSFRIFCDDAKFGVFDPLVIPGVVGGHGHHFVGNTAIDENTNDQSLRTRGMTSCGSRLGTNGKFPIDRTSQWLPWIEDGKGNIIRANMWLKYYKGPPKPGLNYGTAPFPLGGVATASGTTLTRTSGSSFIQTPPLYTVGGTIYFGADNFNTVPYTIATIPNGNTMTLTTAPPAGSGNFGPIAKEIYNAAANQCNDEWGMPTLTTDQRGNPVTDATRCPPFPRGLRFVTGFNKANGQGRPDMPIDVTTGDNGTGAGGVVSGSQGNFTFECWKGPNFPGQEAAAVSLVRSTLAQLMADAAADPAVCPIGSVVHVALGGPTCWNGYDVDTPDHRAHVAWGIRPTASGWLGNQRCPAAVPYPIPQVSQQGFFTVDLSFRQQKWRTSMDNMVDGLPAGAGIHFDYWEGWDPIIRNKWNTNCVTPHNSCTNEFGDGTGVTGPVAYDGSTNFCNGCAKNRPDRYVKLEEFGMSFDITGNGTFTKRIKAPGNGMIMLMGQDGLTVDVDNIQVIEVAGR